MARIANEKVWGGCDSLRCGLNRCDGHASVIAAAKSYSAARTLAIRRVKQLKYREWRKYRRLKCPTECKKKKIVYIYSPAPKRGQKQYIPGRKEWFVQYNVRWQYWATCTTAPSERAFWTKAGADTKKIWEAALPD